MEVTRLTWKTQKRLNGLEADDPLVKTQMTVTKEEQNAEKPKKNQTRKPKNKP